MRNIDLINGEYYHIYNRGVDKREVFLDKQDFWKFFDCLRDFNNKTYYEERLSVLATGSGARTLGELRELSSLNFRELSSFLQTQEKVVDILSYNLIPNHFHLILKQLKDNGIPNIMHKVSTSYTNYFNKKYNRSGALFEGPYKIIHIDSNDYLLWLLGYVNGNIEIHNLGKASEYSWSSYRAICKELSSLQKKERSSLSKLSVLSGLDIVLEQFGGEEEFKNFVEQVIKESRTKKEMEKYLLE